MLLLAATTAQAQNEVPPDRVLEAQVKSPLLTLNDAAMAPGDAPRPVVDPAGKRVVKGSFPTEPSRLTFELEYSPSDGEWKLIRIHVTLNSKTP